jgi:hypothetical protein
MKQGTVRRAARVLTARANTLDGYQSVGRVEGRGGAVRVRRTAHGHAHAFRGIEADVILAVI